MKNRGTSRESTPRVVFEDDWDGDLTEVARFDLAAYARATSNAEEAPWGNGSGPGSGVRPSLPTLPREVGALVNEPEDDMLLRYLGGGDRELRVRVSTTEIMRHPLDASHGYVLGLLDGVTSIGDVLDISALPRIETLRAIEALAMLGIVG